VVAASLTLISSGADFIGFLSLSRLVVDGFMIMIAGVVMMQEFSPLAIVQSDVPVLMKWYGKGALYMFLSALCASHRHPLQPVAIAQILLALSVLCILEAVRQPMIDKAQSRRNRFAVVATLFIVAFVYSQSTIHSRWYNSSDLSPASGLNYLSTTKVATIVEMRPQTKLVPIISSFIGILPAEWPFVLWLSPANVDQVLSSSMIRRNVELGKVQIKFLPGNMTMNNTVSYSKLLTRPWFWEQYTAEHILLFQTDSILCSRSHRNIDDFFGWDYIGAPWPWSELGGNGGLSLRSREAMLRVTRKYGDALGVNADNHPEDIWFVNHLRKEGKLPPKSIATTFSKETIFEDTLDNFGFHSYYPGGQPRFFEYCPEFKMAVR